MEAKDDVMGVGGNISRVILMAMAAVIFSMACSFIEDDKQYASSFHPRGNASEKPADMLLCRAWVFTRKPIANHSPFAPLHIVTDQAY